MQQNETFGDAVPPVGQLIPELAAYERQIEAIKQDARDLLADLTDKQFNWRPAPGRWSIAECIDHLRVSGAPMLPRIAKTMEQARADGVFGRGPFRHSFLGNLFVRYLEPPPRFKSKAPKILVPTPERPMAELVPEFMTLQDQLQRRIREANGIDLAAVKIVSPITKFVKLSLGQWFALLAAHERRHLWQARGVKDDPNFPRS